MSSPISLLHRKQVLRYTGRDVITPALLRCMTRAEAAFAVTGPAGLAAGQMVVHLSDLSLNRTIDLPLVKK
jgi:hypothetical protein